MFASVNGSHKWTPWLIFAALRARRRWRRSPCCGACFATPASSPTPTRSSTPPTARSSAARRSSSARTPSSSSSPRSPRTTSRSRCARCRCSPQRAVEVDGDRLSDKGRDYLRAQHRGGRADAGADRGPAEVLPRRDPEPAVRRAPISSEIAHEVVSDLETSIQAAGRHGRDRLAADRRRRRAADPPAVPEPDLERDQVPARGRAAGGQDRRARSAAADAEISVSRQRDRLRPALRRAGSSASSSACTAAASTRAPGSASPSAGRSPSATAARSRVESTPGEGSVFTVTLPLKRAPEPSIEPSAPSEEREREAVGV